MRDKNKHYSLLKQFPAVAVKFNFSFFSVLIKLKEE